VELLGGEQHIIRDIPVLSVVYWQSWNLQIWTPSECQNLHQWWCHWHQSMLSVVSLKLDTYCHPSVIVWVMKTSEVLLYCV